MLKIIKSFDMLDPEISNNNSKVVEFGIGGNSGVELAKKLGKLKGQKLSKSQKTPKSKKLSKIGNSFNFGAMKAGPNFLTFGA